MTSRRCPGKVLRPLGDTTVLGQLLENLAQSRWLDGRSAKPSNGSGGAVQSAIAVATSTDASDDPISAYCRDLGIPCVRGPLANVAQRFAEAANCLQLDAFVRISGDSPLFDYRLLDTAISMFLGADVDLVTNVFPRSFPRGESVEVIRTETFLDSVVEFANDHQREHVTPYFYEHHEQFRILNRSYGSDQSRVHLAIDTEEDYEIINSVCHSLSQPIWHYPWPTLARLSDDFRSQAWGVAV
jgi:spore coat polysaccharide biosynthesis protein SpsF (cytidylyltransferase family)